MRIQNNIMALNTHRQYNIANKSTAGSAEKLSSGYRINRAGDDAAGLAISEKMRAQIRGLNMASKNSLDGVSLIQTAEGALQSTHDILQRMRELAVQSSSDTNEQVIDRGALDKEFQALKAEIDDTAAKTRFNDQNLIDGTFAKSVNYLALDDTDDAALHNFSIIGAKTAGAYAITVTHNAAVAASTDAGDAAAVTAYQNDGTTAFADGGRVIAAKTSFTAVNSAEYNGLDLSVKVTGNDASSMTFQLIDTNGNVVSTAQNVDITGWKGALPATAGSGKVVFEGVGTLTVGTDVNAIDLAASDINALNGMVLRFDDAGVNPSATPAAAASVDLTINGETVNVKMGDTKAVFSGMGIAITFGKLSDLSVSSATEFGDATGILTADEFEIGTRTGAALVIQTGANEGDNLAINIDQMNSAFLRIEHSSIATRAYASKAITEVNNAINMVSTQRAALGALQNRLEFKIANLDTSAENLQAAESRIRDVDMAAEMTKFTKSNILVQAATAMLAQANSQPQNVLQLLR